MALTTAVKQIFKMLPYLNKLKAKHILFDFDNDADVLYVSFERPQRATDTQILKDGTLLRVRGKKVVGLTILNISERLKKN